MENKELSQKWPVIKEKLLAQYPQLTPEELEYKIGKEGELLETLQKKLNKNWKNLKEVLSLMG